uniref:Diguanylate cyclase (GGDEF) domain-containing protein n=1 Tax=Eubacterium plexicaudatum ASF492 TaxID=1235802 RepID=N2AU28_9FIRM
MLKIFIRHTIFIITSAILIIFFINFLLTLRTLKAQQFNTFYAKSEQMIHTLETNQEELSIIQENLNEDYLTRARAAAYVFDTQQDVIKNVKEMSYLARLLNVDELHVIDENGIIVSASISRYVGYDMSDHEQSAAFLSLLNSDDENAYLIQEAQPNAVDKIIMKYIGVSRKGHKGIVQVGFKPTRQLEAESRNTYEYIFSRFPTDEDEELFAVDRSTGTVLGHSSGVKHEFDDDYYRPQQLLDCTNGAYKKDLNGKMMYVAVREYNDILICFALPFKVLVNQLLKHVFQTLIYLLFVEIIIILLLNYLVKQKVINGIHQIMEDLFAITNGNLDTTVTVGGNRELETLSAGINAMVKSIISISDHISTIIQISGIPLAAFEYKPGRQHVFVTSGLKELLDLPDSKAKELYQNSMLFDQYIGTITDRPIAGETDIFKISDTKYVRIHMSGTSGTQLGVITDVSKDVLEKRRMFYENTHDALTGLYKYAFFKQQASDILHNMPSGHMCAVVMLDLDHFKSINDTHGHDAGDLYLKSFASVLKSMPTEHFITARRSGDEFSMLIYDCVEHADIIRHLDAFYQALKNHPVTLSAGKTIVISASAGFSRTFDPDCCIDTLLSQADTALYHIKRTTKGRYWEYSSDTAESECITKIP